MQQNLLVLSTVGHEITPPDPGGTASVFRRIGYQLEDALADLIDNSIDAGARTVLVRFVRGSERLRRVIIADDGHGMDEAELKKAMQYGVRSQHRRTDLGKYGIGLKAASFSQCRSLSVITQKRAGDSAGRRWTVASIEKDWRQEVLHSAQCATLLNESWGSVDLSGSGTLVIWDELDELVHDSKRGSIESTLAELVKRLPAALGLRFHRFLANDRLTIILEVVNADSDAGAAPINVIPLDPFGYDASGHKGFPLAFPVDVAGTPVVMVAHIWPPKSKSPNYRLGGGNVAARQGFYFYRNDRLIQPGGWNGLQNDTEPHYSLARVCIDLPPELDSMFKLSVQKSKFDPPPGFTAQVDRALAGTTTFRDYLNIANEVYRSGQVDAPKQVAIKLGKGLPAGVVKKVERQLGTAEARAVDFVWAALSEDRFFNLDRENGQIILNNRYRKTILGSNRASVADAPLVKTLLFLLLRDQVARQRSSKAADVWLEECNTLLVTAAKVKHGH